MTTNKTFKVICYVDGFNLYHAIDALNQPALKGANLWSLAESYLRKNETLQAVEYFSAYATWLQSSYRRHQIYTKALASTGVTLNMAHFKKKHKECRKCSATWVEHEEKETDVHIALKMLEDGFKNKFDRAFVISGDSDLVPAVKKVKDNFPDKEVFILVPPKRWNKARDLIFSANNSAVEIKPGRLAHNLFVESERPREWK